MAKSKSPTFEDSFDELTETVQKLEGGELALEDAISLYERGIQLAEQLQKQLEQAELRVRKLKPSSIELSEVETDDPDGDAEFR